MIPELIGLIDEFSVSLNGATKEEYNELSQPKFDEAYEEVKKFRPTLEVDQAEDAIYNNDLKDISDIMQEMLRVAKETEK